MSNPIDSNPNFDRIKGIEEKLDINFIFKRKPEEYHVSLTPTKDYMKQAKFFVMKNFGLDAKAATKEILKSLKKHKANNPIVTFNKKDENGDMQRETDTLTNYIKETVDNGQTMAPSFTTYVHPSVKRSVHSEFLDVNIKARKIDKKLSFKYGQQGDVAKELYHETMQKIRKIYNNSLSGAYGSKSTILYNPSAHYTLTSMTRCVASIGNMTSESMVAGNKYFKDPEVTINYVAALAQDANKFSILYIIEKFDIHVPTPEEVMDAIYYSSQHYWKNKEKEASILKFLSKLDDYQLVNVMYANDFWHFMKYNDSLARKIVKGMSERKTEGCDNHLEEMNTSPEGINNLVHHICMDDIKGLDVNDYSKFEGTETLKILASTAKNIKDTMFEYGLLFKVLYTTSIMPTSVAYIKDMLRDTIVLSDTDSTCGSYDKWVEWYCGGNDFTARGTGIAAAVMTINTQVMDHHLKLFARNMNVDQSLVELLKMKNEYYWPIFVATNVSKHYFADTAVREGNVFSKTKLELKGVHLIASSIRPDLAKFSHDIMSEISHEVKTKGYISLEDLLKRTADKERELIQAAIDGDVTIFKSEAIKDASAYKQAPHESPFRYYKFWQDTFADKYGSAGEPTISIIKLPLTINNKTKVNEFLEAIEDEDIKKKLTVFFENKKTKDLPTMRIPTIIAEEKGIPKEFVEFIDKTRIIEDNLRAMYYVLESIGYYRKGKLLVSESGY